MRLTIHAARRMQQRSIPPLAIELLESFGSESRCGGASRLFFDKAARRRLEAQWAGRRSTRHLERLLNVYVVIADTGAIVTAAYRTRRFHRS